MVHAEREFHSLWPRERVEGFGAKDAIFLYPAPILFSAHSLLG